MGGGSWGDPTEGHSPGVAGVGPGHPGDDQPCLGGYWDRAGIPWGHPHRVTHSWTRTVWRNPETPGEGPQEHLSRHSWTHRRRDSGRAPRTPSKLHPHRDTPTLGEGLLQRNPPRADTRPQRPRPWVGSVRLSIRPPVCGAAVLPARKWVRPCGGWVMAQAAPATPGTVSHLAGGGVTNQGDCARVTRPRGGGGCAVTGV